MRSDKPFDPFDSAGRPRCPPKASGLGRVAVSVAEPRLRHYCAMAASGRVRNGQGTTRRGNMARRDYIAELCPCDVDATRHLSAPGRGRIWSGNLRVSGPRRPVSPLRYR